MRSLLELPSGRRVVSMLADWVEMSTMFRDDRSMSSEDLVRSLVQASDTFSEEDEDDDGEEIEFRNPSRRVAEGAQEKAANVFEELSDRQEVIGASLTPCAYPFELDRDLLRLRTVPSECSRSEMLYLFLLAISRASMESTSRTLKNIDPTKVFERLCADVLRTFWGGADGHSDSLIMGTALGTSTNRSFPEMIGSLCDHLREGGGWNEGAISPGAGDGGLDVVVWRRFSDERAGSLVGFAQCKTGDRWKQHLGRHNPRSICNQYFRKALVLDPLPVYMVPCRVEAHEWDNILRQHVGIIFDRCRIAQYGTNITPAVMTDIKRWFNEALKREMSSFNRRLSLPLSKRRGKKLP